MAVFSVATIIQAEIAGTPGITSSEICCRCPELNKDTITSCISKLKKRGLVVMGEPVRAGVPARLYLAGVVATGPIKPPVAVPVPKLVEPTPEAPQPIVTNVTPIQTLKVTTPEVFTPAVSREEIIKTLEPFAEYAKKMVSNKIFGNLNVWLSATTDKPTVQIVPGQWFLDALDLMKKLS